MEKLLKAKNLSETAFRKEVLSILLHHKNAIKLSQIEKKLKKYNRITLYRTIKTFIEKGLIHEIRINGEESSFAICKEEGCSMHQHKHQHVHFKCDKCNVISCVEVDEFPSVIIPNYQIGQLEIQASGLCSNCNI